MLSMVVFPQPECPIRQTNSPCSTPKWMSSNTVVSVPSRAGEALGDAFDSDERVAHCLKCVIRDW